jgi:hypothetical protein
VRLKKLKNDVAFIYIVGVGRSGTSLLQSMFAAHSDVCMLPETSFLRRYTMVDIAQYSKQEIVQLLKSDANISRLGFSGSEIDELVNDLNYSHWGCLYESLTKKYCTKEFSNELKIIGDKDPRMVEYLPALKSILPAVHIIHIIRDPRDILVSKKKAKWSSKRHPLMHIFANMVQIELGCDFGQTNSKDRYYQLSYEELLRNPREALEKLCGEIGIGFETSMLSDFGESAKKIVSQSEISWKKETFGPLLKNNIGKWEGVLSYWEISLIEACCKRAFYEGEYVISNTYKNLPWWKKLMIIIISLSFSFIAPIYKFYHNRKIMKVIRANAVSKA